MSYTISGGKTKIIEADQYFFIVIWYCIQRGIFSFNSIIIFKHIGTLYIDCSVCFLGYKINLFVI